MTILTAPDRVLPKTCLRNDAGYSAPSAASIYALAEPDLEPLPRPTRTGVVWDEHAWTEIDPATGAVLATGFVPLHSDHVLPEADSTQELRP